MALRWTGLISARDLRPAYTATSWFDFTQPHIFITQLPPRTHEHKTAPRNITEHPLRALRGSTPSQNPRTQNTSRKQSGASASRPSRSSWQNSTMKTDAHMLWKRRGLLYSALPYWPISQPRTNSSPTRFRSSHSFRIRVASCLSTMPSLEMLWETVSSISVNSLRIR